MWPTVMSAASGPGRTSSRVAKTNALCEGTGLCVSVDESRGKETTLRFHVCPPTICARRKKAGVHIENSPRFGLHNLRHSLSNWLVNKARVEPKTVQGILRHAKIQTTLDLYTQEDSDETRTAAKANS